MFYYIYIYIYICVCIASFIIVYSLIFASRVSILTLFCAHVAILFTSVFFRTGHTKSLRETIAHHRRHLPHLFL